MTTIEMTMLLAPGQGWTSEGGSSIEDLKSTTDISVRREWTGATAGLAGSWRRFGELGAPWRGIAAHRLSDHRSREECGASWSDDGEVVWWCGDDLRAES